jgi:hypothetical protein
VTKLTDRGWFWIDDDVRNYGKEIEELKLLKERCIQLSAKGAGALGELREVLEKLRYDEGAKALTSGV